MSTQIFNEKILVLTRAYIMFCRQRVWGVLPFWPFLIYTTLSLDLAKLLPLVGPNTRIAWHLISWTIRFDQSVGCLNGTIILSFLSYQTYIVAAALPKYLIVVKLCFVCVVVACLLYCCGYVVVGFFFFLYLFSTFYCPCCRALDHDVCYFYRPC